MSARRNRGDEELGIIGSRAKQPTDLGPLFDSSQTKPAPRKLGPAGKRYSELPPSYDTQIGRHATEKQPKLCPMCDEHLEALDLVRDVDHGGARVTVHSRCYDEWEQLRARERARMPEHAALRGKTAPRSETSELAARAIDEQVPTLAWLVLQHIISCGAHGSTREEATIALGKRLSSVTARCHELYVMGHIGSNCVEFCESPCEHHVQSRINAETGMANEVLVHERYVVRWRLDQSRPPTPLKHGRKRSAQAE